MINFKEILKKKGITQAELARRMDIPPQNLSRMLKGPDMKLSNVIKIADAIGEPVEYLFAEINIGRKVKGWDLRNVSLGDINLSSCQSELERAKLEIDYLKKIIEEKDKMIEILSGRQ